MEAESKLISRFYQGFWLYLIGIIILTIIFAITIILKNKIMSSNTGKNKIVFFGILSITLGFVVFFAIKFVPYAQDYNSVKNKNFETVTGVVVDYGKAREIGDIASEVKYSLPIVEDQDKNKIKLDADGTVLNETYTFIYLKHTKLAVIKTNE